MDFCLKEVCMHRKTAPGKTEAADMSMLRGRGLCCYFTFTFLPQLLFLKNFLFLLIYAFEKGTYH